MIEGFSVSGLHWIGIGGVSANTSLKLTFCMALEEVQHRDHDFEFSSREMAHFEKCI
jgi:hypothetical protein